MATSPTDSMESKLATVYLARGGMEHEQVFQPWKAPHAGDCTHFNPSSLLSSI